MLLKSFVKNMNQINIVDSTIDDIKLLSVKLDQFNGEKLSVTWELEVAKNYCLKDTTGNLIGGINGVIYLFKYLFISILYIEESYRYKGFGSILLKKMEDEAIALQVQLIHLDTFDFQAKDFYLKHGYEIFGVLDDCPRVGNKRYYMKKKLSV